MTVTVFGASGPTGQHLINQLLGMNQAVNAVVRDATKLDINHDDLTVYAADLDDFAAIAAAVKGSNSVLSALGCFEREYNTILSDGTRHIVEAMKKNDVDRLVVVTSLGCRESIELIPDVWQEFRTEVVEGWAKEIWADKDRQEEVIEASGLDYTILRPGALTDEPALGDYRLFEQGETLPPNISISRADLATCMAKIAGDKATFGKIYTVIGPEPEAP